MLEVISYSEAENKKNAADSDSENGEDDGGESEEQIVERCQNIVEVLCVYEAFCNNENGICHSDLLKLYLNSPVKVCENN